MPLSGSTPLSSEVAAQVLLHLCPERGFSHLLAIRAAVPVSVYLGQSSALLLIHQITASSVAGASTEHGAACMAARAT